MQFSDPRLQKRLVGRKSRKSNAALLWGGIGGAFVVVAVIGVALSQSGAVSLADPNRVAIEADIAERSGSNPWRIIRMDAPTKWGDGSHIIRCRWEKQRGSFGWAGITEDFFFDRQGKIVHVR